MRKFSSHCSFQTTLFEQLEESSPCAEQNTTRCHRVPLLDYALKKKSNKRVHAKTKLVKTKLFIER